MFNAGRSKILKNGEPIDEDLHFYFVSELASKGELFTYVLDRQGLPAPVARLFFNQLMSAVHYMHEKGVAHRDVKLENMLLDESINLKLADFGMGKIFKGEGA